MRKKQLLDVIGIGVNDPLYTTKTPEMVYSYRTYNGTFAAENKQPLYFDVAKTKAKNITPSTDTTVVTFLNNMKSSFVVRDINGDPITSGVTVTMSLLDNNGAEITDQDRIMDGTDAATGLARGHYLVVATCAISGSTNKLKASYAITLDDKIAGTEVDADIIPARTVFVTENSGQTLELPTQKQWQYAMSFSSFKDHVSYPYGLAKDTNKAKTGYAYPYFFDALAINLATPLGFTYAAQDWLQKDELGSVTVDAVEHDVIQPLLADHSAGSFTTFTDLDANPTKTGGYRLCKPYVVAP